MSRIVWLSDFDIAGSGYLNISVPLCQELSKLGHEVKAIGIGYKGQEHSFDFSIIPAGSFPDVSAIMMNLIQKWNFDVFVCALDIPHQEKLLGSMVNQRPFKYIGIMPVEAAPLCSSWAMALMRMDQAFIISEYGAEAARDAGVVTAEHIQIGVDTKAWRFPTPEEKAEARKALGIEPDEFVVMTVADNQERKNPHILFDTFKKFSEGKKARYIFITREANPAGARLRDYAGELKIHRELMIIERGIPQKQLFMFYAVADAFLLASKAEGLGMPILEAFACGVPVAATNCTAMAELLADGRGLLVDYRFQHRDCFGNGWRYWFDPDDGAKKLNQVYEHGYDILSAREYVEKRTWDIPANQLNACIARLVK